MNYALNVSPAGKQKPAPAAALKGFVPFLRAEWGMLILSIGAILLNAAINLAGPYLMGRAIDEFIARKQYGGVVAIALILVGLYLVSLATTYLQARGMGGVAQRLLYRLRDAIFRKLQELPLAFFQANASGDLISRINNDTDRLNQFFSQSLMHFIGNAVMIAGTGAFLLAIHPLLGAAALAPAAGLVLITRALSPWIRRANAKSLQAIGGMSGEIQESLEQFPVIVAFNRREYFRRKFADVNERSFRSAVSAGIANVAYVPLYGLCSAFAQIAVLAYGITLIAAGEFTVGLLISMLAYVQRFYDPLRQVASMWGAFQGALAAWDRIAAVFAMESDLPVLPLPAEAPAGAEAGVLELQNVTFRYREDAVVLRDVNLTLQPGKTYALVGPTGGGKTTTASLMARLYDPTEGTVLLQGRDIRAWDSAARTDAIGFILQEPFLFTGSLRDNILYGNNRLRGVSDADLQAELERRELGPLLERFGEGLGTKVTEAGGISLGQRQLIAFIRAVLRDPALLILDEATANVDTVTEGHLDEILKKLPARTAKVIIAHRLNTIENADEIFFVNGGAVTPAGSMEHAVEMLLHGKRTS